VPEVSERICLKAVFPACLLLALVACASTSAEPTSPRALSNRGLVLVDAKTGAVDSGFPDASGGAVVAAEADGKGGWFIGGDFKRVGKVEMNGFARLGKDGTLIPEFAPRLPRYSSVYALAYHRGVVYAGGVLNGGVVFSVAAFDAASGRRLWQVPIQNQAQVNDLAFANGALYIAGNFTHIGGVARDGIVALDPQTGKPTGWRVRLSDVFPPAAVNALGVGNGLVYLVGAFNRVNRVKRALGIAAVSARTG
jgi:outer membrane protein assembly factor BamB